MPSACATIRRCAGGRRQSGAEQRGFAESDGALRNSVARGTCEPLCSCRPVWPVDRPCARPPPAKGHWLDMDSSVSPTHGEQEMSVWNGHCASTCYHPLFVFNQVISNAAPCVPAPPGRARGRVLQQARHVRAMDQGKQGRDRMDAAVVPDVRGQRRAASTSCARLQSRQFLADAGDARGRSRIGY